MKKICNEVCEIALEMLFWISKATLSDVRVGDKREETKSLKCAF
jgi:hypothetical protein